MPRIKHITEMIYKPTFRSQKVVGMFDIQVGDKLRKVWDIDLPIEERDWQIGLITGLSGSGKTTIANKVFGDSFHKGFTWDSSCLLDDFPEHVDVKDITATLSRVGFSSPPQWLLPYNALSNGQQFRVELARCLFEYKDLVVFDEFSSVVDRQVAQIGSFAFQKAIRKTQTKFVAVTCHYDVEEWLQPDWVLDISSDTFKWGCLRRPEVKMDIRRVHHSAWNLFKDHHYLTASINTSAACFAGFINDRPVVFDAWLPFFGRLSHGTGRRGHRTVCLPDFQGLGLGNALFNTIAKMWAGLGYRVFSGTAHPAEIKKRVESANWRMTRAPSRTAKDKRTKSRATNRLTCGFEYTGEGMPTEEAKKLYAA